MPVHLSEVETATQLQFIIYIGNESVEIFDWYEYDYLSKLQVTYLNLRLYITPYIKILPDKEKNITYRKVQRLHQFHVPNKNK